MIRVLIDYFWPILLPVLLYVFWYLWARKRQIEGKAVSWRDGPWLTTVIATLVIALLCFGAVIFLKVSHQGDNYVPAQYKNGKLIPAEIK